MKKLALEALQEIRIKYRRKAIDQENEAIEIAKVSKKKFQPTLLTNDNTLKQLLAKSRYFLYKNKSKWAKNQTERAEVLFELYPDIKKAYDLAKIYDTSLRKQQIK